MNEPNETATATATDDGMPEPPLSAEAQAIADAAAALPAPHQPSEFVRVRNAIESPLEAALHAIEAWYEGHFHRAAVNNSQPISSVDKAALVAHVTDALTKE